MSDAPFNPTGWTKEELAELERAWTPMTAEQRKIADDFLAEIRQTSASRSTIEESKERG